MELVSLKRPEKKADKETAEEPVREPYPWGTRIRLEKEELDKLQMTVTDFDIGNKVSIVADAEVVSLRESANQRRKNKTVELQITAIGLGQPKTQKKSKYKEFQTVRDSHPTGSIKE